MKIKTNKRMSQRGFMDPGSWGLVIGLVLIHAVFIAVTVDTSGVRPGEPLPTLPTIP